MLHYLHGALFSLFLCFALLVLHSFHVARFSYCALLQSFHDPLFCITLFFIFCYFFHCSCSLCAALFSFRTFFVLHSSNVWLFLSLFMFFLCFTFLISWCCFYVSLFSSFTVSVNFLHVYFALFPCSTLFIYYYLCCTFFMLHRFHIILVSCCTVMREFFSICFL